VSLQIPRIWRRRLATVLGIIGVIMLVVGLATGYIDVSLWGIFVGMTGQAIVLQERKRPG
jgi:low temperature requirement protein LtrA